jgi:Zn-dependent M28 family amino/carboxypeptidase
MSARHRLPAAALAALAALLLLACDGDRGGPATAFDGAAALQHVQTQLAFGPRIPGSIGHRRAGDWIVERMRATADTVIVQQWTHVTQQGDTLPLRNVLARFRPEAAERVLYVSHWDTRPVSDGPNARPEQRSLPVPGANDGASSTALLVALAELMARTPPAVGVDLLFVDGEDYGSFDEGKDQDVLLGSRHFALNLPSPDYRPLFGVVWDMIGDADLQIYQEGNSIERAPEVVSRVWEQAAALGYADAFVPRGGQYITDDHIPLLDAGLRVIDVIDIDYPYHHTPEDTIARISQRSLQIAGDVAAALVMGGE